MQPKSNSAQRYGRRPLLLALGAGYVAFAAMALSFLRWIPDDAYISLQYARHLAGGLGLVFNVGERVEGFSNLLWTLILATAARLGFDLEVAAPLLSLLAACAAVTLWLLLLWRSLAPAEGSEYLLMGAFSIALCTFFPLGFFATSGMETAFYSLCLAGGTALHLESARRQSGAWHVAATGAFLAAALSRPEGVGFLLINAVFGMTRGDRTARTVFAATAVSLALFLAAMWIKYLYFGTWLPNTFFAKPPLIWGYSAPLTRGADFLIRAFGKNALVMFLPLVVHVPHRPLARYLWALCLCLAGYQVVFIVLAGGDVLRFDRFLIPLVPWFFVACAVSTQSFLALRGRRLGTGVRRLVLLSTAALALFGWGRGLLAHRKYCVHDWMHGRVYRQIAAVLDDVLPKGSRIAVNEIGALSYYTDRPVIDMLGLTDATVSAIRFQSAQIYGTGTTPWSARATAQYVFARNPSCVILPAYDELSLEGRARQRQSLDPIWFAIFTNAEFIDRYRPLFAVKIHDDKFLYVFVADDVDVEHWPVELPAGRCLQMWRIDGGT